MHKTCAQGIKEIIGAARNSSIWAPKDVIDGIRSSLVVSVQRGNANMVSAGLEAARRVR